MNRLHVLGRKNHGKTTLIVELIEHLTQQGYRVGAIKHTHHSHQLDVPGKDSHRFGVAGAAGIGVLSLDQSALFWPSDRDTPDIGYTEARYEQFAPMLADCDLVLVEGDTQTDGKKIEVWRAEVGTQPIAKDDASILAVVSDDRPEVTCPVWSRSDSEALFSNLLGILQ